MNKTNFLQWKQKHAGLWQLIMFMLMSGITTIVDFSSYVLFNFWIFKSLSNESFHWWIIDYSVEDGGLAAFYAFALSFAISQTFNFFLQRKTTFKANNNVLRSGVIFAAMVIGVYIVQILVPSFLFAPTALLLGSTLGGMLMKVLNMTLSMVIQFPLNKYVIMKNKDPKK